MSGGIGTDRIHRMPIRVYYEDTDAAGIVYYANYLRFVERARTEMIRDLGIDHQGLLANHGIAFAVRRCATDYRRPARLDDMLEVETRLTRLGGASMELAQVVRRDGEVLVECDLKLAVMTTDGRPARLPPDVGDKLTPFVVIP